MRRSSAKRIKKRLTTEPENAKNSAIASSPAKRAAKFDAKKPDAPASAPPSTHFQGSSKRLVFYMTITSILLMLILFLSSRKTSYTGRLSYVTPSSTEPSSQQTFTPAVSEDFSFFSDPSNAQVPVELLEYERTTSRLLVEALCVNSDVKGYLTIDGTPLSFPVLQGEDNQYYLKTGLEKKYAKSGSVFFDSRNRDIASDANLVIYGNAGKSGLFRQLTDFTDIEYFEQHQTITLDRRFWTDGITIWKITSAYYTDEDPMELIDLGGGRMLTLCSVGSPDEEAFIVRAVQIN